MPDCQGDYVKWIDDFFGECVVSTREKYSFGIGLLSTLIWMYAQLPQIYMNYKNKHVDGLSFTFLCLLLLGDICNLTGAIITHALVTQYITATFFIMVDAFCVLQYIYYHWVRVRWHPHPTQYEKSTGLNVLPLLIGAAASLSVDPYKPPLLWGTLIGWCSTASYMSSRTPQIIKNCRRKKTEGLSAQFFLSAFMGNLTYTISIFLKDSSWNYLWVQLPWLLGSGGMLFFDFTILTQFLYYGSDDDAKEADIDNELISRSQTA